VVFEAELERGGTVVVAVDKQDGVGAHLGGVLAGLERFLGQIDRIQQISRDSCVTVLIVEQKVREVLKIAQRVYVLRSGKVSFTGPAEDLQDDQKLKQVYL
jgi:ABC-type lipopolysaccharide export system ATPase subunit